MPTLTPVAGPLAGSETVALYGANRGGTLTLAQLRAWANGQPIGAGAANPPVGLPAVAALDGTEQIRVYQGAGWMIATVAQIAGWSLTGVLPAFALPANGNRLSFAPVTALDGTEQTLVGQAGGPKGITTAQLRAWITAPV